MRLRKTQTDRSPLLMSIVICAALLVGVVPLSYAAAGELEDRFIKLSGREASAVVTHSFGFRMGNLAEPVGSVSIEYCSNSPLINEICTPPAGLNVAGATLTEQNGEAGFSVFSQTNNAIVLTRPAVLPSGTSGEYIFNNVINPSQLGSSYARLKTFTSTDATGLPIETGGVVYSIGSGLSVNTEVPPYLIFCASVSIPLGDCSAATTYFINLGELLTTVPAVGTSEFMVATNAADGYSVVISGTTLTSGNNIIQPLSTGGPSQVGQSQFGINLRQNSVPSVGSQPTAGFGAPTAAYNIPNVFRFQNGDVIASSVRTSDYQRYTVSYLTNISDDQPAGYYATTLTYICLANF